MSGKTSMFDEEFEQSLLAAIFPKATVAAGSFYRFVDGLDDPLDRGAGEVWKLVATHSKRLATRGVQGCPLFGEAGSCDLGCSEAARCGQWYPHVNTSEPLESGCPYHG